MMMSCQMMVSQTQGARMSAMMWPDRPTWTEAYCTMSNTFSRVLAKRSKLYQTEVCVCHLCIHCTTYRDAAATLRKRYGVRHIKALPCAMPCALRRHERLSSYE